MAQTDDDTNEVTRDPSSEETLSLGGSIDLSGFRECDPGSMVIIKKVVGHYAKTFSERCPGFERLAVHLKMVHEVEASRKFEIHGTLSESGRRHVAEEIDYNLFFALDSVLKKLENMIE